jgi:opacity protein-like surface antigen
MKKTTLFALSTNLLLAIPALAQADAGFKSGFKIGVGAGYKNHRVKSKSSYDASTDDIDIGQVDESFKKKNTNNTASFEVHGGYDFIKDRLLAAIEFNYRYSPKRNQITFNTTQAILAANEVPFAVRQSHRHDFGVTLNVGGLATSKLAVYAIANVRLGRFEHKFENNKPSVVGLERNIKRTQYRWGLGGGLGSRYALSDGLSVGAEVTYDVYQKVKNKTVSITPGAMNVGTLSLASHRPRIINVLFKASKTF